MGMGGTGLRSGLAHRVTRLLEMDGRPFPRVSWLQRWLLRPLVVIGVVTLGIATLGLQTHSLGSGTVKDTGWNSSLLGQTWAALSPRIVHPSLVDQHDTSSGQAQVPAFSSPSNDADTTRWIENIHWPKQPHQQTNFFTRTFQISSNEFSRLRNHPLFQELPGDVTLTSTAPLKNFDSETQGLVLIRGFARAGFVIDPPKQLYYNARTGLLMIRAELRDLELVERLLVSAMSPSQIGIEANFIETSPETAAKSGLFGMVGKDSPLPLPGVLSRGVPHVVLRFDPVAGEPGEEVEETVRPRVLSPSLVRTFLKGLENVPGVNILSSPTVLTLSGHQAQIQAKQSKSVVLGTHRPPTGAPLPVTQVVEVGPQLDVIPRFLPEINQVDLRLVASLTEFIGYDKNAAAAQDPDDPRPVFQLRQVSRSAYLKDGESLAFCLGSDAPGVEAVALQHPSVSGTRRGNRVVFVLVTATLVDAAGNRLNPE